MATQEVKDLTVRLEALEERLVRLEAQFTVPVLSPRPAKVRTVGGANDPQAGG